MRKRIFISIMFLIIILHVSTTAGSGQIASWYGGGEPLNTHTASGEVFNPLSLACASWDYPFNTYLRVTNVLTGKNVIVRVNDRGPAKRLERAVDLTRHAFMAIADLRDGLVPVRVERVR